MRAVFIGSNTAYCGKVFVTLGLGLNLIDRGYKVGFIKPHGKVPMMKGDKIFDVDAVFIKDMLGLPEPLELVSPFVDDYKMQQALIQDKIEDVEERVLTALHSIKDKDYLLIGGAHDLFDGSMMNIDTLSLIEDMDARVLMVELWRGPLSLHSLYGASRLMKDRFVGAVINKVPEEILSYVRGQIKPFLESKGIPIFGVLPRDKIMSSITVRNIVEAVKGGVLCGEDGLEEFVDNFLVGAMDVAAAMSYFARTPNKAVITGAHRTDIQLAAMETSTKCIVLTGGDNPSDLVVEKAQTKGIPIIIAPGDTFTAVERIDSIMGRAHIQEKRKADRAKEIVKREFDVLRFIEAVK